MKFAINNKITGAVQFEAEIEEKDDNGQPRVMIHSIDGRISKRNLTNGMEQVIAEHILFDLNDGGVR